MTKQERELDLDRAVTLKDDEGECDFVPGADGRWYLWWPNQNTWIVSVPSVEAAQRFVSGWSVADSMDLQEALCRVRRETGEFPRFDLGEHPDIREVIDALNIELGQGILAHPDFLDALVAAADEGGTQDDRS